jgi:hypothetical protein
MTSTNSRWHILERAGLGFLGSTLVSAPAALNWFFSFTVHQLPQLVAAQISFGIVLIIGWVLGFYFTAREPEPHLYGCLVKAAGLPGLILAIGHGLQIAVQ